MLVDLGGHFASRDTTETKFICISILYSVVDSTSGCSSLHNNSPLPSCSTNATLPLRSHPAFTKAYNKKSCLHQSLTSFFSFQCHISHRSNKAEEKMKLKKKAKKASLHHFLLQSMGRNITNSPHSSFHKNWHPSNPIFIKMYPISKSL